MIVVFFLWVLIFFVFLTFGFTLSRVLVKIHTLIENSYSLGADGYFFMGFLSLSALTGILSIFIPIATWVLIFVLLLFVILLIINYKEIKVELKRFVKLFSDLNNHDLLYSLFLSFLY